MTDAKDTILTHSQISHKLTRLAWQVFENNMDEAVIWIAGLDKRGMYIADKIAKSLSEISSQEIRTLNVITGSGNDEATYHSAHSLDALENGVVILVDDVLNTGKTMVKAMVPLIERRVRKIQVLVLASRSHRLFPVRADFVGISMASTLQEHLNFDNSDESDLKLTLS